MNHRPYFITKTLSALVVTAALAAFQTAPASAQTADKLDCKDCVKSKHIKDGKIKGKDLKDGAVENEKIAEGAVDGAKIADGAVDGAKIADGAVDGSKIADGSVGNSDLGPDSVTRDEIVNGTVRGADVATDSIPATDLSDEPGINVQNSSIPTGDITSLPVDGTWADFATVTLTAPASGFVHCTCIGYIDVDDSDDTFTEAKVGIDDAINSGTEPDAYVLMDFPAAALGRK